ncbi:hypothetical protein H3V53_31315 [Paraburkholderia bengalensis]|uniref:Uncharacterized protein n=1 Tax=Paraburkholderia bengalensis TaxID=2747562 RepID=A0ABU8J116_9BURK
MSRNLFLLAIAASLSVALPVLPQMASAQPSALRPMQDAQRKAEQKARQAKKKDDQQADTHGEAQQQESPKPASSP